MRKFILHLFFALLTITSYAEEKKVALIIGNDQYEGKFSPLTTCVNDAKDVKISLERLGYKVIIATNASNDSITYYLEEFKKQASGAKEALFYFSGHGVMIDEKYYLVPSGNIDVDFLTSKCIDFEAIQNYLKKTNASIKLIFIDACKNDLEQNKGPAESLPIPCDNTDKGTICFFATSNGSKAKCGKRNSLFTQVFLKHIGDSENFGVVWKRIVDEVLQKEKDQQPYYESANDALIHKIKFNPYRISIKYDKIIEGKEYIKFHTIPENATISINKKTLTNGQEILLEFGKQYEYSVSAPGYETYKNTITFAPDISEQPITLTKLEKASLDVKCNINDALVRFDGKLMNQSTPLTIETVTGTHNLSISKKRYSTHNATMKLSAGNNYYYASLDREFSWFWSWDDNGAHFVNYHFSPKYPLGVGYMFRPEYSRFSFGAIVGASTALFRGWSKGLTTISQSIIITIPGGSSSTDDDSVEKIDGSQEHYSEFIDPYNEAKHYDASAYLLANVGFNPCNGIMLEAGVGAGHHRDKYYMKQTYLIEKITPKEESEDTVSDPTYKYTPQPNSKWYKENGKWSTAIRLGTRFFIPIGGGYSDIHLTLGGGYTYMLNNHKLSSWDANIGVCLYL